MWKYNKNIKKILLQQWKAHAWNQNLSCLQTLTKSHSNDIDKISCLANQKICWNDLHCFDCFLLLISFQQSKVKTLL